MGLPGKIDGGVYSANLDGTDIKTVVGVGYVNTPKQITLDASARKVYFCDREGGHVYRCNVDGSEREVLISTSETNGDGIEAASSTLTDGTQFCVGITVSPELGKFYWTQKGPSKAGQGRIFCADISTPSGKTASTRTDIHCILSNLPEPIDLDIRKSTADTWTLEWTDRGELPFGNSLYRIRLDKTGLPAKGEEKQILSRNFNETIGLARDSKQEYLYLTDLGGSIYQCDLDGRRKERIFSDPLRALTGIAAL